MKFSLFGLHMTPANVILFTSSNVDPSSLPCIVTVIEPFRAAVFGTICK